MIRNHVNALTVSEKRGTDKRTKRIHGSGGFTARIQHQDLNTHTQFKSLCGLCEVTRGRFPNLRPVARDGSVHEASECVTMCLG